MKILITGSAGFIGFHLARKLANLNHSVEGLDNFNNYYDVKIKHKRNKLLKTLGVKTHKLDLTNTKSLEKLLKKKKYDCIIHLAAQAGVRYSIKKPDEYIKSNIVGSYNLLNSIKNLKVKHFLFASTSSVYGNNKSKKFDERMSCNSPISLYSATKKSIENIAHSYSYNFNIPITSFRFFTVYGPWGRPDMALFKFVKAILENKSIEVFNYGKMFRDFTYIDDLVESVVKLIKVIPSKKIRVKNDSISKDAPFRVVNIGNQNVVPLMRYINEIENALNKKAKKKFLPMQAGDVSYTMSDSSLLKRLTGYTPSTNIKTGIKNFCHWYKNYYKID